MNISNTFCTLSELEEYQINGGSTLGNVLVACGCVVACFATGPVGFCVGVAMAGIGFIAAQGW